MQRTVLVANANTDHAPVIAEFLGDDYSVRPARTIEEAVARLEGDDVDVVIADVRWLEASPPLRQLTVAMTRGRLIITSGLPDAPLWWDGPFVSYPEGITTILKTVEQALEAATIAA